MEIAAPALMRAFYRRQAAATGLARDLRTHKLLQVIIAASPWPVRRILHSCEVAIAAIHALIPLVKRGKTLTDAVKIAPTSTFAITAAPAGQATVVSLKVRTPFRAVGTVAP